MAKYEKWIEPNGLIKIEGWARDGLTNEQIAENIGVRAKTLYEWQKKYPAIAERLAEGKEVIDRQVENALLKRALGYQYVERSEETDADGCMKTKITVKEVVPDVGAQAFWLKNRKPSEWRDKHDIEVSKPIDESIKEMEDYFEQQKKGNP